MPMPMILFVHYTMELDCLSCLLIAKLTRLKIPSPHLLLVALILQSIREPVGMKYKPDF